MALPYSSELEAITNDYFAADGKAAVDNYFNDSYGLNYFMKQQKGLWQRPEGGFYIRVPIEYDEQVAAFYARGGTVSSDDVESLHAAQFGWRHCYGNATIRRIDGLKNAGTYAQVSLVTSRLAAAQKSLTKLLSESFYDDHGAGANRLTGMRACCSETATTAYGGIQEDDLVSTDGTKVWEGKTTTTTEGISLAVIRTLCSGAKVRDGKNGKPDVLGTTETLFNVVADILQVQQRFTDASEVVKAGFTGLKFEGKEIFADDYIPSGYMFAFNSKYLGFAIHKEGYFMRTEWKVIPDSPEDKTLKLYWDGNLICSLRKAQIAHSNLS